MQEITIGPPQASTLILLSFEAQSTIAKFSPSLCISPTLLYFLSILFLRPEVTPSYGNHRSVQAYQFMNQLNANGVIPSNGIAHAEDLKAIAKSWFNSMVPIKDSKYIGIILSILLLQSQSFAHCGVCDVITVTDIPYSLTKFDPEHANTKLDANQFFSVTDDTFRQTEFHELLERGEAHFAFSASYSSPRASWALKEPLHNARIFFAVPTDANGIKNLYGETLGTEPDQQLSAQFNKAKSYLEDTNLNGLSILDTSETEGLSHADEVLDCIRNCYYFNEAIIFAHKEDDVLRFPDNSRLKMETLFFECEANSKTPIVFSCNSQRYYDVISEGFVAQKSVYFEDFAKLLKLASDKIKSGEQIDVGQFIKLGDTVFVSETKSTRMKARLMSVSIPVGSATIAGGTVVTFRLHESHNDQYND